MSDLAISNQVVDFNATTVWVRPASIEGSRWFAQMFGSGACDVELRKSGLMDLEAAAARAGLTVQVDETWTGAAS